MSWRERAFIFVQIRCNTDQRFRRIKRHNNSRSRITLNYLYDILAEQIACICGRLLDYISITTPHKRVSHRHARALTLQNILRRERWLLNGLLNFEHKGALCVSRRARARVCAILHWAHTKRGGTDQCVTDGFWFPKLYGRIIFDVLRLFVVAEWWNNTRCTRTKKYNSNFVYLLLVNYKDYWVKFGDFRNFLMTAHAESAEEPINA